MFCSCGSCPTTWGCLGNCSTADSLADLDNYDSRDWGSEAFDKALELCLAIVPHVSVLTVFMVECSYVIQIFFGKNQDDTGTFIASPSHLFKFCPSNLLRFASFSLPFVQAETSQATYFDHLFTTVSMVCVTELFTQPVASTYNIWGQLICMLLIQIGGLGL